MGLAVTREGVPIRVWTFPDNAADSELIRQVKDDLLVWKLGRVVWVSFSASTGGSAGELPRRHKTHRSRQRRLRSGVEGWATELQPTAKAYSLSSSDPTYTTPSATAGEEVIHRGRGRDATPPVRSRG